MKQNIECMRSILRVLEKELTIQCVESDFYIEKIGMRRLVQLMESKAPEFSREDIAYSVIQLIKRNYIITTELTFAQTTPPRIDFGLFLYITPEGHAFLNSQ